MIDFFGEFGKEVRGRTTVTLGGEGTAQGKRYHNRAKLIEGCLFGFFNKRLCHDEA